jgi:peptidoglycan hydrolase-like protein with peptidoglycan-binding domain
LRNQRLRGQAADAAERTSSALFTAIGVAALAVAIGAALPAEAKKRAEKPTEEALPDPNNGEPMTLVVSLGNQRVDIYRGLTLVTSSKVSTGMRGYATKAGVFSILEKKRTHHSNLYSGAPMPWMQRLTWSGTALHAGVVPGYPASHGCIRLPFSFAPKLFKITGVGEHVVVARDSVAPQIIEHDTLFQPLPPPAPPTLVKQDNPPQRQSSLDSAPADAAGIAFPIILAKAGIGGLTLDRTPPVEAVVFDGAEAPKASPDAAGAKVAEVAPGSVPPAADPAAIEDTHIHAFDPFAGQAPQAAAAASTHEHALDEDVSTASESVSEVALDRPVKASQPVLATAEAQPAEPAAAVSEPATLNTESPTPPAEAASVAPKSEVAEAAVAASEAAPAPDSKPAEVEVAVVTPEASPAQVVEAPAPDVPPSIVATKAMAGTNAAAILAAEPRSTAPLRILVTRRTQRDLIIGVQKILADMGYLPMLDFDGTLGRTTADAIKEFQKANGLPETGAFTDELVEKVYAVAGKGRPPVGHLFVRQEFASVFDAPVSFRDPEKPLGTHLFTAMNFAPGDTKTQWMAISVQGDDAADALDRLEIPGELRRKISERLTPGSSLIIGDTAINSATLPKGADFLVWAKDTQGKVTAASANDSAPQPRRKKSRTVKRKSNSYSYSLPTPRTFGRGYPWPW